MLHLVALRPVDRDLLVQAVALIRPEDAVVFLDHGLALLEDDALLAQIRSSNCHAWADGAPTIRGVHVIDAEGLVALSEAHTTSLSWYPEAE